MTQRNKGNFYEKKNGVRVESGADKGGGVGCIRKSSEEGHEGWWRTNLEKEKKMDLVKKKGVKAD